ncbi:hypothetical protein Q0601_15000 [Paracoccus onubensis]|uniref:hypothetical protein n=1 Tax=Paracoccus onubensis TaxID=1675788 RepID=UPI0027303A07|nr:hypothetical protein [Paracoccus onubensis]MDP0928492.1 hypothetical protein [Paracoccus onubensis]
MFYRLTAESAEPLIILSCRREYVDRYLVWLNHSRQSSYVLVEIPKSEWEEVEHSFDIDLNDNDWNELPDGQMSADSFSRWISDMKSSGLAETDLDCARALGCRDIIDLKEHGGNYRLALACQAALRGLAPYQ